MNTSKVIEKLRKEYPGKNIILNPPESPTEIVCEADPENGVAIAVIDRSEPHHHLVAEENYKVTDGFLTLYIDGSEKEIAEGDEFVVYPGEVHFAIGDETWVEIQSTPPWTSEDHRLEIE